MKDDTQIIKNIMKWGKAQYLLQELINNEIFDSQFLSKHNPYFHSEDDELADKLDDLRRKFVFIQDKLSDIIQMIEIDDEY